MSSYYRPTIRSLQVYIYSDCCWLLCMNSKVYFYHDNWIGKSLVRLFNLQNHVLDLHLKVYAFLNEGGTWVLPKYFVHSFPGFAGCI